MADFYNPFMSKPDYGQGFGDMANRLMQMIMMSKMFPQQGQEQLGQTQTQAMMPGAGGNMLAQAPGTQQPSGTFQGISPAILQQLLQMMGMPGVGMGR